MAHKRKRKRLPSAPAIASPPARHPVSTAYSVAADQRRSKASDSLVSDGLGVAGQLCSLIPCGMVIYHLVVCALTNTTFYQQGKSGYFKVEPWSGEWWIGIGPLSFYFCYVGYLVLRALPSLLKSLIHRLVQWRQKQP